LGGRDAKQAMRRNRMLGALDVDHLSFAELDGPSR
jgi:hypothetical protein